MFQVKFDQELIPLDDIILIVLVSRKPTKLMYK